MAWSSSNTGLLTINSSGVASRVGSFSGDVTITATMTLASGCGTTAVKKVVHVGTPSFYGAGQYQFDACTYQAYISPQSGGGPTWSVVSGSVGLGSTTGYSVYATSTTGGVIAVTISNACGNSTMEFTIPGCESLLQAYPNPASDELILELKDGENIANMTQIIYLYHEGSTAPILSIDIQEALSKKTSTQKNLIKVDVSKYPRGTYYLHLVKTTDGKSNTEKTRIILK